MKTKNLIYNFLLILALGLFMVSCSKDDEGPTEQPLIITQSDLDKVTTLIDEVTGGSIAHGGPGGTSPDSTYRLIYSGLSNLSGDIPKGTIVTKKTHKRNADGTVNEDMVYVSFAMVKRETGYNTDSDDWSFIVMPNDGTDYSQHPNGVLPANVDDMVRGKLASCISCHQGAGGGDMLFVND